MAFSLNHQKSRQLELGEFSREQFLVLALEAAQNADWDIGQVSAHGFSAFTRFSLSSFSEEVSVGIQEDRALITSECVGTQLFDWRKNYRNLQTFRKHFEEVKSQLSSDQLENRYSYLQQEHGFSETAALDLPSRKASPTFFSLFLPKGGYFITPILLNLNLLIFLTMAIIGVNGVNPDMVTLINWGGNYQLKTLDGEIWRLLTCTFLHASIFHVLMNMFALVSIGTLLEPLLGRTRFLTAYLVCGLLASLTSVWWTSTLVAIGASGAIFGLYGLFLALLFSDYLEPAARKAFMLSTAIYLTLTLVDGLTSRGIDNAAHFGGLLAGMACGFIFLPALRNKTQKNLQRITLALPVVLAIALISTGYKLIPNNLKLYKEKVAEFKINQAKASEVYDLEASDLQNPKAATLIKTGTYYWTKNLKIADEIAQLNLTKPYYDNSDLMRNYSEIRLKQYELIRKIASSGDPEPYRRLYKRYNANILWCMRELETLE